MKFIKWLFITLLSLVLLAVALVAHEWHAKKPFFFRAYLDRTVLQLAMESPEALTSLGFLESLGMTSHNADLDDASPKKSDELYVILKDEYQVLKSYDGLSEADALSKEIALYLVEAAIEGEPYRYHNYPVNQLFGIQSNLPSFLEAQHQIRDEEAITHYLSRLSQVERKFSQSLEGLKIREEKGILPPRFVIERVLDEMQGFVATPATDNIIYTSFATKLDDLTLDDAKKAQYLNDVAKAVETQVYPAYQSFISYFANIKEKANEHDGLWRLPDGERVYELALKQYTTTDLSADDIHQTGLDEVARIQGEIMAILTAEGYPTDAGFTAAIDALAADERFYYEDSDEGRAQILADYQSIIDEIELGMSEAFNLKPKAGMEVVRIPEFKEKTAPGAYYQQPAIDGSRPGRFFANLYDIKATPKYSMRTLAYHEAVPGHHYQIALGMEMEGLPFFRRASPFTAYTEGWALYAEQVAWEMGYQKDPFDNVGRLQAELFRAVRLVVDTGIHAKRWTREEAIDYMRNNTGMALSDVTAEIERYIVMPGQATAYKIGMMEILRLRDNAKAKLGADFDIRDFHDVVLKNGAVPLAILERLVGEYVEEKQALASAATRNTL